MNQSIFSLEINFISSRRRVLNILYIKRLLNFEQSPFFQFLVLLIYAKHFLFKSLHHLSQQPQG